MDPDPACPKAYGSYGPDPQHCFFFQATVQLSQSLPPNFGRFSALEDFKSKMAAFRSPGAGCPPPNGVAGSQEWSNSLVKSTNTFRLGFTVSFLFYLLCQCVSDPDPETLIFADATAVLYRFLLIKLLSKTHIRVYRRFQCCRFPA
jgi:hypothetical protein